MPKWLPGILIAAGVAVLGFFALSAGSSDGAGLFDRLRRRRSDDPNAGLGEAACLYLLGGRGVDGDTSRVCGDAGEALGPLVGSTVGGATKIVDQASDTTSRTLNSISRYGLGAVSAANMLSENSDAIGARLREAERRVRSFVQRTFGGIGDIF